VDVSRAVTATSGRRAVTAGRCVPQCRAPQLLHPARALGSPWRARVNDSSAARHRGESRVRLVRRRCPGSERWRGVLTPGLAGVLDSSPATQEAKRLGSTRDGPMCGLANDDLAELAEGA